MKTYPSALAAFTALPVLVSAASEQQIGSWVVTCPDSAHECLMRLHPRFLDKAGLTGDLEVQSQQHTLVPVIALRGLSSELLMAASVVGNADVSLQFPGGAREKLSCNTTGSGYICAPDEKAAPQLSASLATARSVKVRVALSVAGMTPLPARGKSIDLAATSEALARLRAVGPTPLPPPIATDASAAQSPAGQSPAGQSPAAQSPAGMIGMADKMLKAAGFQQGVAGLQALLAKYMNK